MQTRITSSMQASLTERLGYLGMKIEDLRAQSEAEGGLETAALLSELTRERDQINDALERATLIDDHPFDTEATEIGDTITIRDSDGHVEQYVLIDGAVGARAHSDWVSARSPLGAELVGRSKGERIWVDTPGGRTSYVVVGFERSSVDRLVPTARGPGRARSEPRLPSEAFLG